jgi:uncharacterized protein (DUF2267 family)
MSTSGLDVFDKTLQATHIWLDEISEEIGSDRQVAWKVLSAVLHVLRDRLSVELAAHLGAQLPLLVRGLYYDQFAPARQPSDLSSAEDFTAAIARSLAGVRPVNPNMAIAAVLGVLSRHISEGQISNVRQALPHDIRALWPGASTVA